MAVLEELFARITWVHCKIPPRRSLSGDCEASLLTTGLVEEFMIPQELNVIVLEKFGCELLGVCGSGV